MLKRQQYFFYNVIVASTANPGCIMYRSKRLEIGHQCYSINARVFLQKTY